jgi:acetate kinase
MSRRVLSLNAGSSSLKFALFEAGGDGDPAPKLTGSVENIGARPHLLAKDGNGVTLAERHADDAGKKTEDFLADVRALVGEAPSVIGHRIVHGGADFTGPALIDDAVMGRIEALSPLAPLHQPHNLAGVRAAMGAWPGVPQVACFDTAFHATQPAVATRLALPRALEAEGVRRYGFHGLSYDYISGALARIDPAMAAGRVIVAHLGSGASLCALQGGRSIDTTMGFTPLDGLVMGTRCGALDPGVVLYLIQALGWSAKDVETCLYRQSGLLGVSGLSSDMRELEKSDQAAAREAIELFVYRLAQQAGGLASALGGVDGLVFTAGIGEHSPSVRAAACERLAWLGLDLDPAANEAAAPVISTASSRVKVRLMATNEELVIARQSLALVAPPNGPAHGDLREKNRGSDRAP